MRLIRSLFLGCVCLVSAACVSNDQPVGLDSDITVTELSVLPAPRVDELALLDPLDRITINVVQDQEISGVYVIDDRGNISFPYVDNIRAAGLTPVELALRIQQGLAQGYIRSPSVNVVPVDTTPPSVSIGGQVNSPGSIPARDATTLLRGINRVGGVTEYAVKDDVLVFREVDGTNYIGVYNLSAISRGNYPDPAVYPGDIIMVGDNVRRRRFEDILQVFTAATSSLVLIDRVAQ